MHQTPFQIKFYSRIDQEELLESQYLLLYAFHGSVELSASDQTVLLNRDDFFVINPHQPYRLRLFDQALLMVLSIETSVLTSLTGQSRLYFNCCSSKSHSVKYDKFRYIIGELLSELAVNPSGMNCAKMSALYKICDYLCKFFSVSASVALPHRMEKLSLVLDYMERHYREKLTLETVAGQIYMTPTSFSRMFSKEMGTSFVSYLNRIRLNHAADALLTGSLSVSDIAFQHGFGSIPQFNKLFKRQFGLSPREYQRTERNLRTDSDTEPSQRISDLLGQYQVKTRHIVVREQKIRLQSVSLDTSGGTRLENPWESMVNLGFISRLMSAEYQRQIQLSKETLNFEYGVVNGLFSMEMNLFESDQNHLNFIKLDQCLDFLTSCRIKPMIVLDNRVISMLKEINQDESIICVDIVHSIEQLRSLIHRLIDHILYRYGLQEVNDWQFSLWHDSLREATLGIRQPFHLVWDAVYESIRELLPDAKIGGCGFSPSENSLDLAEFYTGWKKSRHVPDFLTIHSFPYKRSDEQDRLHAIRRNIDEFFIEDLHEFQSILRQIDFPDIPIISLEWNLSFVQRNAFNDMAGKAAIMMRQMIHSVNELSQVAYWPLSDLYAEDYDADQLLNGACGLISTNGICKPVFYAMRFFHSLQRILVARGEHYIVTKDDMGHFCIILCNHKTLNYNYYSKPESEIEYSDAGSIFENPDDLEISMTLNQLPEREYSMRVQKISPSSGSVLDEWFRLGQQVSLTAGDISYLKYRSIPERKSEHLTIENHSLTIQERLEAHEMICIQLI